MITFKLLGERYGWSLPTSAGDSHNTLKQSFEYPPFLSLSCFYLTVAIFAQVQRPWLSNFTDRSVTELEVIYNLNLHSKDDAAAVDQHRSLFYFRDPAYINTLPTDEQLKYKYFLNNIAVTWLLHMLQIRRTKSG